MIGRMAQDKFTDWSGLATAIKAWGKDFGFQAVGIADADLSVAAVRLADWLGRGYHGEMDYMGKHGVKRSHPAALHAGTLRIISARIDYSARAAAAQGTLEDRAKAYVSRYALGRDYHKLVRSRLQRLADRIERETGRFAYRVYADSAPVMEVELASKAGLGWRGKHTLLLAREAGSYFFLGEIYTDLPLPVDPAVDEHCGSCTRCIKACPTGAIIAPYTLDARRCISYLTIELKGSIPEQFRALIGNRVYGCDDCQLVCPWNRFARISAEADFAVRNGLDAASLAELFAWSQVQFGDRMAGSPILRIGHERWMRNLAVGLGNAPASERVVSALRARECDASPLVREHVAWALARHMAWAG
jgi:epoxyqueuosine reductase